MKKREAVIFDMDGVIVDSEPSHERAFLEVMRELGYGDGHGLRFADYVGRSDQVCGRISLPGTSRRKPRRSCWP